jgi:ribose 5-phosphate isomerase A
MTSIEALKKMAAEKAVEQVKSGMVLGLGTGSTAYYAVAKIGQMWQAGELTDIVGVPTSEVTAAHAAEYGVPLGSLDDYPAIDVAIDGADEVDPQLNVIKGLGGALLREKMVEGVTQYFIVVVDERKISDRLGLVSPVPVEVVRFSWRFTSGWLESLGCTPVLRGGEASPYVTDNGNFIIDCHFANGINDPLALGDNLQSRPGVVEHGLFLGMANQVIAAASDGIKIFE